MSALAIRVIVLCLAAAMLSAAIRVQRPELALALSLAVGIAAMLMAREPLEKIVTAFRELLRLAALDGESASIVLKAAGVAILSELGVQVCSDAGESALAGRIRLVTRVTMLGMAMPLVGQVMDGLSDVLGKF